MQLNRIRPDDIVNVDKRGHRFLAVVVGAGRGELAIKPVDRRVTYRTATAREVVGHWSKRAGTEVPPNDAAIQEPTPALTTT